MNNYIKIKRSVIVGLLFQLLLVVNISANIYDDYSLSLYWWQVASSSYSANGNGTVDIEIDNDVLTVTFNLFFGNATTLKTGEIAYLNTSTLLPDMYLGTIVSGYTATIESGYLKLYGSTSFSEIYKTFTKTLSRSDKVRPSLYENFILSYSPTEAITDDVDLESYDRSKLGATISYFDGLGRPLQTVMVAQSPTLKDIITFNVYDAYGRETKKYLSYADEEGNPGVLRPDPVTDVTDFYSIGQSGLGYALSDYPYSKTVYENSPLNRVFQQGAPGANWQPYDASISNSGHTVKTDYSSNVQYDVMLFQVVDGKLENAGGESDGAHSYYKAGQLYKTVIKDENWETGDGLLHTTEEYKDKLGQVVLKRSYVGMAGSETAVETYYVYDDFGLLRFVLPPQAVENLYGHEVSNSSVEMVTTDKTLTGTPEFSTYLVTTGASMTLKNTSFKATSSKSLTISAGSGNGDLLYSYKYDGRKRMIEKKIPGAAPVYMVYDKRDRLVATQDGEMRKKGQWLFTRYDVFNRPVITGIYSSGQDQSSLQAFVDSFYTANPTKLYENRITTTSSYNYTNQSFPSGIDKKFYLTVTYYDSYGFLGAKAFKSNYNVSDESTTPFTNVKGQVTGTRTKVLDGNELTSSPQWTVATHYYDDHYRVLQSISELYPANNGSNYTLVSNNYDFVGKVENCKTVNVFEGTTKIIDERFDYDHAGRLLKHYHKINGVSEVLLVDNTYNELGELITKKVGNVQQMDYQYNIRGWLKQINNPDVVNPANKKFAMRLHYNSGLSNLTGAAQYNGNIAAMEWRSPGNSDLGMTADKQAYGFTYDALNRLTAADYGEGSSRTSSANAFNVSGIQYDFNGNIMHLNRQGDIQTGSSSWTQRQIDNLTYAYIGNQLQSVSDAASSSYADMHGKKAKDYGFKDGESLDVEYSYDLNGNMTVDKNKKLKLVEYNYLNLPKRLTGEDNKTIEYIYDANGQKLVKKGSDGNNTYYAGGLVYKGNSLQYILTAEGMYQVSSSGSSTTGYQYNLKDHLGNVRLVVNADNIVDQTDYYPFGLNMTPKYAGGLNNLYKYNGKELQEDVLNGDALDWYDYGARMYDPAIGRFNTQDPMTDFIPAITPYNYVLNNPVGLTDPNGMWPWESKEKRRQRKIDRRRRRTARNVRRNRALKNQRGKKSPNENRKGGYGTCYAGIDHGGGLSGGNADWEGREIPWEPRKYHRSVDVNFEFTELEEELEIVDSEVPEEIIEPLEIEDPFTGGALSYTGPVFQRYSYNVIVNNPEFEDFIRPIVDYLKQNKNVQIKMTVNHNLKSGQKVKGFNKSAYSVSAKRGDIFRKYLMNTYGIPGIQIIESSRSNTFGGNRSFSFDVIK